MKMAGSQAGGGGGGGGGRRRHSLCVILAVEVALAAFCAVFPPQGRGVGRKPLSGACLYAGDILLRRMYPCPLLRL